MQLGDVLDWAAPLFHVSVVESFDGAGRIRSIGSGGPTGRVALQPTGGGYNRRSQFRGFARPPQARLLGFKRTPLAEREHEMITVRVALETFQVGARYFTRVVQLAEDSGYASVAQEQYPTFSGDVDYLHRTLTNHGVPWGVLDPESPAFTPAGAVWFNGTITIGHREAPL